MGRVDANTPPQSSDQPPFQPPPPPPQGYPNHHDNPLSSSPAAAAAAEGYDQNMNHPPPPATRSFIPQSPESMPPPEAYPPQKPATYPPQQPPAAYPPPQPEPVQYPPPQQQQPVQFPPPQQQQPVQFPPPQQTSNATAYNTSTPPQSYNYVYSNPGGYQTPVKTGPPAGIAIGTQYLAPTQDWRTGLFDCAEDPENALITACFPCITFGQIAEIVDNGQTSCATSGLIYGVISAFIGVPCIMSCGYRTKIRNRYGLMETPAPDWATHCFCEWCALCQEYRELKHQGFDPAIGWQGNMARNQQMQQYPTMTPPNNQTMM